ncbi:AMP-binding protein [Streptomyces anatolicus]|nr:AMP-binding protein [Streptomyces anatolicus]
MKVEAICEFLRFPGLFVEGLIRLRSFDAPAAHKGMWLAQKMASDSLNHAMIMWDVDGELDTAAMESAFRHVLDEAEVLRVNFVDDGGGLRMVPRELGDWQPFSLDFSAESDPEQAAREALAEMVRQPFDLERDLLFRLGVVRLAATRSLVVIAYHHLISDGYGAAGLLSRRLAEVYTALARGEKAPEPPHSWDTESFTNEAAEYHASPKFAEDTEFWRDYLKDSPAPAQVPRPALPEPARTALSAPLSSADRWSEVAGSLGMVSRTLTVPRAEADAWTEAAKAMGVWMSSMLTAATAVFLRHRCDRPDFLFSLAVGNRVGAASRTPALAVNVVPVRVRVPLGATLTELADALGDETYEIFDHTACHYSEIQRASGAALSDRGSFGAVVNVTEFAEQLHFADHPARYLCATTGTFDELSIAVGTDGSPDSDLCFRLDAPAGLYSRADLHAIGADLIAHIRALLAAGPQTPVGALDVLSGAERDQVLAAPHATDAPLPGLALPELFARQVERTPDAVAMEAGDAVVSYRELDERSSRLAEALRRRGLGPETVTAVALPRSVDLAVALLGIAKAGGAYLPVDPALPAARITSVVGDSSARALLTDPTTAEALAADLGLPALLFGDICAEAADGDAERGVPAPVHRDNLLAVVHGSTAAGAPTGVAVTHRNMERFALDRHWQEDGPHTVLWHAPHTSDALALELWVPLLNGGRVVVAPPGQLDIDALTELREEHQASTTWLPTAQFAAVSAERPERLAGFREVWVGGDRVPEAAVRRVREACPGLTVVNGPGLTAPTLCARPMDNTALYVLGPGLAPVPVGVTGELYVAGPAVARGHAGRPGQTAERFVPCPFGPAGAVMYRTGERARWGADGLVEYVGRVGAQAEIRGVRVEVAEVEEALAEHPGLAQAVVVAGKDDSGQQRLVAYVVPAGGRDHGDGLAVEELRRFAAGRLPEYMVPSLFMVLERLPLTPGARVDRAALPEPAFDDGRRYRAPRNHTEQVLTEAFADVLEVDRVGIDDDFFDLGGNSLRAIRLVGLIRAQLNQEVSIRTLFAVRTVAGLSDTWKDLAQSSRPTLRRRTKEGEVL